MGGLFTAQAQVPCIPDVTLSHYSDTKFYYPDSLQCITRNVAYSGTISVKMPSYYYTTVGGFRLPAYIDFINVDSISGSPVGIISEVQSANTHNQTFRGGDYGCIIFTGTTLEAPGKYNLTVYGSVVARLAGSGQYQVISLTDPAVSSFQTASLRICETATNTNSISTIENGISFDLYPDPNQGSFRLSIAAAERVCGDLSIVDLLGRVVYTQPIEALGTAELPISVPNLATGRYLLVVKDATRKSVKQFIIE